MECPQADLANGHLLALQSDTSPNSDFVSMYVQITTYQVAGPMIWTTDL